jgi:hypothetical protein
MPNKNLRQKLQNRKSRVMGLMKGKNSKLSSFSLGALAYETIKGSYGKTINPFVMYSTGHSQFRDGFKQMKKQLTPKSE